MVTKKIKLKIWEDNYVIVHTEKGEVDSRYIEVAFKDENFNNLDLTGKSVTFFAQKPDETQIFNVCTVNTTTNTATVELTSEALNMAGVLICEFQIFDSNNVLLKVGGLRVVVASEVDFNEAAESSSSADVLTVIMNSIGDLSMLTTTEKSNLVGAVNELDAKVMPISQGGTGDTTATGARTNLEVKKEFSLYSNNSGTSGTVALSDSSANYDKLVVYYFNDDSHCFSVEIASANGKTTNLITNRVLNSNSTLYVKASQVSISGSTITFDGNYGYVRITSSSVNISVSDQKIKIYKVVGYKY